MTSSPYRMLTSVDRLLADPRLAELAAAFSHERVAGLARAVLDDARTAIAGGTPAPNADALVAAVLALAERRWRGGLRPVINATGVVIQTNLGRAPLSAEAAEAMRQAATGYSNLEFDLEHGERGSRYRSVELLLTELTGAEAAMVVGNNAAAVLLGLMAVAQGKEVVVSRGEAVEIGGGFRIPDVLRQSGARLVEVGTTNRTYIEDYDNALSHESAALLRVHTSNFRVVGFTHSVELSELVELARRRDLAVLDDLGSGCLLDTAAYGMLHEPLVQDSVAAGVDAVFFSGDKLLGGPQAGIVVGKQALVDRLKRHPLARAVRADKASLAGLATTLGHYLKNEATQKVPIWQMIATPLPELDRRAGAWAARFPGLATVEDGRSMIGGGSLPGEGLPTRLLAFSESALGSRQSVDALAAQLRTSKPAVVARIERDCLLIDPRTVLPGEDEQLLQALAYALPEGGAR